jgi:hypothetical protein
MSNLDIGNTDSWIYLFEFFSYKPILFKLDFLSLLVKLIPSAAVKTRSVFKVYTNVAISNIE